VACCLFAVWVQAVGAFRFTGTSYLVFYAPPKGPGEMCNVWKLSNVGFLIEARNPRQPASLLRDFLSLAKPVPGPQDSPP
jgi:hypothetical protein